MQRKVKVRQWNEELKKYESKVKLRLVSKRNYMLRELKLSEDASESVKSQIARLAKLIAIKFKRAEGAEAKQNLLMATNLLIIAQSSDSDTNAKALLNQARRISQS